MAVCSLDLKRFNLASMAIPLSPFSVPAAISSDWLSLAKLRFCFLIIITNIVIFIPVVIVSIGAQFLWFSIVIINIFLPLFIIIDIDCFLTEKKIILSKFIQLILYQSYLCTYLHNAL